MTDTEPDSADDERSLFAKILRRSADELEEQPDDQSADGTEQRADGEDGEDDDGDSDDADPIDRALADGAIEAGQASRLREVAERMEQAGVQTLVDAISENDLDVDEAVEMIEAYNGEEDNGMDDEDGPDDIGMEGRSDDSPDDDTVDEKAIAELQSRLETLDDLADLPNRIETIEQRLDDLADSTVDEDALEQRLESVGESLDEEFEDLIQRADITHTPNPKSGETDGEGTLADAFGMGGD